MDIHYRTGKKEDCPRIAELINIASGGVIEYLFHGLVPDQSHVAIIVHNLEGEDDHYSYKNAIVAENSSKIVGMALSFSSDYHNITKEMKQFFPPERLAHLHDFYLAHVENSLFLDAICVDEAWRKKGIGSRLVRLTQQKARESGCHFLSLIVFADNLTAQSVYKKSGFEVVKKIALDPHEYIPHEGGCLLMNCDIRKK